MKSIKEMVKQYMEERVEEILTENEIESTVWNSVFPSDQEIIDAAIDLIQERIDREAEEIMIEKVKEIIEYYE